MGWLSGLFGTDDEQRLKQGMQAANDGKPEVAIEKYDAILATATDADLKSRCLLNRALAYSALNDYSQAENDLKMVLKVPHAPDAVHSMAREKLARLQKRVERVRTREEAQ